MMGHGTLELNSISIKIGKSYVGKLKDLALKESIHRQMPIKPVDIVREALEKAFPEIFHSEV